MTFSPKLTATLISTVMMSAAVAALAGAVALADPPHGCPPGLAMQGRCSVVGEPGRRDHERVILRPGEHLRAENYIIVRDPAHYRLPPPPRGHYYVIVDEEVVLIEAASRLIVELLD